MNPRQLNHATDRVAIQGSASIPHAGDLLREEIEVAYAALEALEESAVAAGVTIEYRTDFDEFVRLRSQSSDGVVNPMLNPKHSKLDRDAFWLKATDRDENVVALFGAKVFRVDDVMALIRSERFWFDRSPVHAVDPRAQVLPAFGPFGGVISHGAGLWTARAFRTRGLAALMSDYVRALAVKNHGVEWHTCTTVKEYLDAFTRSFAFEFAPLYDGWCPLFEADIQLYLGRVKRPQLIEGLRTPNLLVNWGDAPTRAAAAR
jgi:hypothetical protein